MPNNSEMTTPTTAEQMVSSDTIDAYHLRIKLAYDLCVADCDDHDQALLRASVAAATFAMSSVDAARYARRPLPQSGGYACDEHGVIPADTARTIAETDYNHEQAMNAIASLLRSHEALRATIARLEGELAETKEKLWAITDIDKWPTTEQVAAAMRRIPKRDHDIIDRHFDHGATLMTAAKWEMRKAKQRADAAERRVEAVTALVAVMEQMAAHAYEHWNADRDAKVGKILGALASSRPGYSLTLDAARQAVTEADTALDAARAAGGAHA